MTGTAQNGVDYALNGMFGQVDIPAGATSATVTLHALNDAVVERTEKATMTLCPATNYRLSRLHKSSTVKITNVP